MNNIFRDDFFIFIMLLVYLLILFWTCFWNKKMEYLTRAARNNILLHFKYSICFSENFVKQGGGGGMDSKWTKRAAVPVPFYV